MKHSDESCSESLGYTQTHIYRQFQLFSKERKTIKRVCVKRVLVCVREGGRGKIYVYVYVTCVRDGGEHPALNRRILTYTSSYISAPHRERVKKRKIKERERSIVFVC
jgi:hypothetical protein